jgi:phosphoribosyl 1,2-cyclic phosphodiesterase
VIAHPHPDHVLGLKQGAPCPVYAIEAAWEKTASLPIQPEYSRALHIRTPARIGDMQFEPFWVVHSVNAPAVGYRITAKATAVSGIVKPSSGSEGKNKRSAD